MLRKTVIILVAVLMTAGSALALLPSYGVKAGYNLSDINTDDLESSTKNGYVAGAFVQWGIPLFNLQAEALYTTKGFDGGSLTAIPAGLSPAHYEVEYNSHFIEIPVLTKFALPLPIAKPSVYAGPAVSIPVKAEMKDSKGEWQDTKSYSKDTVWSLIMGADVKIMDKLIVDIRYDIQLTELNDKSVDEIFEAVSDDITPGTPFDTKTNIKGRTFTVMVGWQF